MPWVEIYAEFFPEGVDPLNRTYYAAYVLEKGLHCFVITYGKSHFYVRPFCDHDFGIEMAKRVADPDWIRQKSSKRFAGRRRKEINAYISNSALEIESGESIDYLHATLADELEESFGKYGKFGSSILINPSIGKEDLGVLLDRIVSTLREASRFTLPRTTYITDENEIQKYDARLRASILGREPEQAEFSGASHEIVGVDFVFSGNEDFSLYARGHRKVAVDELDMNSLRQYIRVQGVPSDKVLDIRVKVDREGQKSYSRSLKASLDFVVDGANVTLAQGKWLRFNEDYLNQLNAQVDRILIEEVEPDLLVIVGEEEDLNAAATERHGYTSADKDFSKIKVGKGTLVEAWDLYRDTTAYAVKFGKSQKLGYVVDQAMNVLEILRNNANTVELDINLKAYTLWLGFDLVKVPESLSASKSIILKQKIDAWARQCRNMNIEPRIKMSLCRKKSRDQLV
ncbi:sporadically distributed protein, TIGR04141 family [Parafrankia irregularis]|uniref:Sporadically distributed protein, TIGR04141 family n=2 Tax=Frankiaceae TaxID=74712 RepID=A0A0S4QQG5_9ACTN|nr:sporadically distributed protein, TIGR04141 family [Parafrankia irregularis]